MWTILLIGGGILAVFLILRVLGGLFGRSSGAGYPNQAGGMGMPRPGMGPGGGPGYYGGGGGYGGRPGGGFFSSLLGGLGGAMAGNWLYDQMSGRHGGSSTSAGMGYGPDDHRRLFPTKGMTPSSARTTMEDVGPPGTMAAPATPAAAIGAAVTVAAIGAAVTVVAIGAAAVVIGDTVP